MWRALEWMQRLAFYCLLDVRQEYLAPVKLIYLVRVAGDYDLSVCLLQKLDYWRSMKTIRAEGGAWEFERLRYFACEGQGLIWKSVILLQPQMSIQVSP